MLAMRTLARQLIIGCLALSLTGCINTPPVDNLPPVPEGTAPLIPAITPEQLQPYHLQIGDVLSIKLMLNPELNDEVIVRPDGMISTTVSDDVQAAGRTVKEVREDLVNEYKKHLKDPQISVLVRSFAPNRIYVMGEVNQPGEFITVGPNLTLLQAVARAGGIKPDASPDQIVLLRRGEGEKPQAFVANYKAAVSGADPLGDVRLAPYDVVVVPRSAIGDVYLYFQQYVEQFVPASFGLSYQVNPTKVN